MLFYLEHIATLQTTGLHLERRLADYFRQNIWVTGSGLLSERYLRWTAEVIGVDRMMYSTDYPFTYQIPYPPLDTSRGRGRQFLEQAPLTEAQKAAFGSENWERLTRHLAMPTRS